MKPDRESDSVEGRREKGDEGERVSGVDKTSRTRVEWNGWIMEARRIFD